MDDEELIRLASDLESELVERKQALSGERVLGKVREAICAFANDLPNHRRPGVVFIGLKDDGRPASIIVDDDLLLKLANLKDDGQIQPIPSLSVRKLILDGNAVAALIVQPSSAPPVRLDGRTWVRVGPRRDVATAEEEARLVERRRSFNVPFDQRGLGATLADIDLSLFEEAYLRAAVAADVLAQNHRSLEDKLKGLRLMTPAGEPTVTGILVLGKDPRRFLPGAYIQLVRYDGGELTDPIRTSREIDGPLTQMLLKLDEVLEANNSVVSVVDGPVEQKRPEYPIEALRQLARNAVMHRTYESSYAPVRIYWFADRIEIQNPGGPFGQVTPENFGQPHMTDYRNPHIAEAMKTLGFVQRFGMGISLARRTLAQNGNPAPVFDISSNHVLVKVMRG